MSTVTKLGDLDKSQIALIVVLVAITILFASYGTAIITAFSNAAPGDISISGEIDFNQMQTLVLVIVSGGLVLLGITVGATQARAAIRENDQTWLSETSLSPTSPTDAKRGIGYEFEDLMKKTLLMSSFIRKIYDSDAALTPAEQQEMIQNLDGVTAAEMEALIPITGPQLAASIRALISKHRATNRSDKDKNS